MSNKIVQKQFYAFKIRLASPLCVSGGYDENTDADVLRNGNGEVFIPGSSIAGALKEALGLVEKVDGIMGYSDGENGKMSSLFISDMYFDTEITVTERDGVKLNSDKTVDNKFDMEIVETGAEGIIYISCIVRENDSESVFNEAIKNAVQLIENGAIRFGANKTRGVGRISLVSENGKKCIYNRTFAANDRADYLKFVKNVKCVDFYDKIEYQEWVNGTECVQNYIKILVPLKLNGGISIRKYSTLPGEADYSHITCNGEPVIPGSSWNGAIRSDVARILSELGCKDSKSLINQWFGYVEINNNSDNTGNAQKSMIVISESIIRESCPMPVIRNKIDRFDASVISGAMYQDLSYFGGTTTLEVMILKDEERNYRALAGIFDLVAKDIQNGYLAVGGLTAVGRGIFESNGDVVYSEPVNDRDSALYAVI